MSITMKNSFTTIFLQKIQGNKRKWKWCFTNFPFILTKHSRENNRKIIFFSFSYLFIFLTIQTEPGLATISIKKIYINSILCYVYVCEFLPAQPIERRLNMIKCHLDIFNSKNKSLLAISRIFSFMIFFLLSV